jgi:hypothetical protein
MVVVSTDLGTKKNIDVRVQCPYTTMFPWERQSRKADLWKAIAIEKGTGDSPEYSYRNINTVDPINYVAQSKTKCELPVFV